MKQRATIAMSDQDYLVFDAFTDPGYWTAMDAPKVKRLVESGAYRSVFNEEGIVVLRSTRASGAR